MPATLKTALLSLCDSAQISFKQLGTLDVKLGRLFAKAALQVLSKTNLTPQDIIAIGSHGQTVCHYPNNDPLFTLQIADPNTIAAQTNITTVADFRRRDMALGGQGAPFVPVFHQNVFQHSQEDKAIINIGGLANITLLFADSNKPTIGYDTGPGNTLLDGWIGKHLQKPYDESGTWAASGSVDHDLFTALRNDPYFHKPHPKSTSREYFNLAWLDHHLQQCTQNIAIENVQATLLELTASTIAQAIQQGLAAGSTIILHGGGSQNQYLCARLKQLLSDYPLCDSEAFGIDPQCVEAMAFAWLAQQTMARKAIDLRQITGARAPSILGGVYY